MSTATARLLIARGMPRLGVVDRGDGIVGEDRVASAGQGQVVFEVAGGLVQRQAGQVVAQPDKFSGDDAQEGHTATHNPPRATRVWFARTARLALNQCGKRA
jgi:hypothetical protein